MFTITASASTGCPVGSVHMSMENHPSWLAILQALKKLDNTRIAVRAIKLKSSTVLYRTVYGGREPVNNSTIQTAMEEKRCCYSTAGGRTRRDLYPIYYVGTHVLMANDSGPTRSEP